jgi:hypothetical protein
MLASSSLGEQLPLAADIVDSNESAINFDHRNSSDAADGMEGERNGDNLSAAITRKSSTYIAGKAYARPSPGASKIETRTPGSVVDSDWILTYEVGRVDGYQDDVVFYGRDRGAAVDPGALAALGFGLGLLAIVWVKKKSAGRTYCSRKRNDGNGGASLDTVPGYDTDR